MSPYPPSTIDWHAAICSFILPAGVLVVLWVQARRYQRQRLAIGCAAGVIVLWILANVLLPATGNVREAARRTQCRNNLKQTAAAVHKYHDEHNRLPPPQSSENGGPPVSWRIDLIPYFGQGSWSSLTGDYNRESAWDDAANLPVARRRTEIYSCPSNQTPQDNQQRWYTAYSFPTGAGTAFPPDGPLTLGQITDGTSNTLLVVEACGQNIVWTEPSDIDVSHDAVQINASGDQPGTSAGIGSSYHEGGAQMALADGSVRFLSEKISPDVLQKLTTAAGGESMTNNEF